MSTGSVPMWKAGIIPAEQVLANEGYQMAMQGLDLHRDIYAHIAGVDLVRDGDGSYYVLEDNLRTPSGVSYMLEDRKMMMRLFPELFAAQRVAPVDHYPNLLLDALKSSSPLDNPTVVVLTPGRFNSAYFEHSLLARLMGCRLVEGRDLFCRDNVVYMRTTEGEQRVDVIYRRIDDLFLTDYREVQDDPAPVDDQPVLAAQRQPGPLEVEQRVDPPDRLQRQRRDRRAPAPRTPAPPA